MANDPDPIPLSALQHWHYCPRMERAVPLWWGFCPAGVPYPAENKHGSRNKIRPV